MKIENTQVFGFESAIRGMRNPKNSWHLSDSLSNTHWIDSTNHHSTANCFLNNNIEEFIFGEKDLKLAQTLISAGTEHMKFMRQIQVWADITMPRYWWSEFDTYKVGTSANSTSTMHKLFDKNSVITLDLFEYDPYIKNVILKTIQDLNVLRDKYFESTTQSEKDRILRMAKQILPESYLNTRTVNLNYATLRNIMLQRRHHRLKPEWQYCFCHWITTLPYAKELIFCGLEDEYERLK